MKNPNDKRTLKTARVASNKYRCDDNNNGENTKHEIRNHNKNSEIIPNEHCLFMYSTARAHLGIFSWMGYNSTHTHTQIAQFYQMKIHKIHDSETQTRFVSFEAIEWEMTFDRDWQGELRARASEHTEKRKQKWNRKAFSNIVQI